MGVLSFDGLRDVIPSAYQPRVRESPSLNPSCPPRRSVRRKRRPPPWTTLLLSSSDDPLPFRPTRRPLSFREHQTMAQKSFIVESAKDRLRAWRDVEKAAVEAEAKMKQTVEAA